MKGFGRRVGRGGEKGLYRNDDDGGGEIGGRLYAFPYV